MRDDDETTVVQLHALLLHHGHTEDNPQVSHCSGLDIQRHCELFIIVLFSNESFCDCFYDELSGWVVSYNGKGRSIFISFHKNGTITLYCHIPYFIRTDRSV